MTTKTAIITGGAKGIGAAITRQLASQGVQCLINYARDEKAAEQLTHEIKTAGGQAIAIQGDIGIPTTAAQLFDAAEAAFGAVDILINNAGSMQLSPLAKASDDAFESHSNINFGGTFYGMREAANRLRIGGRIVSISSSVVGLYQPGYGLYAASKAAVEAMTHVLAKEVGPRNITVNTVAPGPVETAFFLSGKSPEQITAISGMIPLGRLGQPSDIASVVAFLASEEGGWINGQTLRANGGIV